MTPLTVITTCPAYRLVGFDGDLADAGWSEEEIPEAARESESRLRLRIKGGRALYESVSNRDGALDARGLVQLERLDTDPSLHVVYRLVADDTEVEVLTLRTPAFKFKRPHADRGTTGSGGGGDRMLTREQENELERFSLQHGGRQVRVRPDTQNRTAVIMRCGAACQRVWPSGYAEESPGD